MLSLPVRLTTMFISIVGCRIEVDFCSRDGTAGPARLRRRRPYLIHILLDDFYDLGLTPEEAQLA